VRGVVVVGEGGRLVGGRPLCLLCFKPRRRDLCVFVDEDDESR
jgi:hypothetical protein